MRSLLIIIQFLLITHVVCGQVDDKYLSWSLTHRLTKNDFEVKTGYNLTYSFAQFVVSFNVNGFDFLTKNFNKKVKNQVIKSASWIDTTYDVASSLKYQQTLFDLCEVYARRLRKEIKINRKKIAWGTEFIDRLNADVMAEFAKRRIVYDTETKFGSDALHQKRWEIAIQMELSALKEFSDEL